MNIENILRIATEIQSYGVPAVANMMKQFIMNTIEGGTVTETKILPSVVRSSEFKAVVNELRDAGCDVEVIKHDSTHVRITLKKYNNYDYL